MSVVWCTTCIFHGGVNAFKFNVLYSKCWRSLFTVHCLRANVGIEFAWKIIESKSKILCCGNGSFSPNSYSSESYKMRRNKDTILCWRIEMHIHRVEVEQYWKLLFLKTSCEWYSFSNRSRKKHLKCSWSTFNNF